MDCNGCSNYLSDLGDAADGGTTQGTINQYDEMVAAMVTRLKGIKANNPTWTKDQIVADMHQEFQVNFKYPVDDYNKGLGEALAVVYPEHAGSSKIFGVPVTWLLLGGAAVVGYFVFLKKKK